MVATFTDAHDATELDCSNRPSFTSKEMARANMLAAEAQRGFLVAFATLEVIHAQALTDGKWAYI